MTFRPATLVDKWGVPFFQGEIDDGGGGSSPGAVRVLSHAFDFTQAAALDAGVSVFTPAVGDWLLGAWIETEDLGGGNNWVPDGLTVPLADIGIVAAGAFVPYGLWSVFVGNAADLTSLTWDIANGKIAYMSAATSGKSDLLAGAITTAAGGTVPAPIVRFLTTDPLKLVVSNDGTVGGGAFDGSAGASTLHLVVSTPTDTP